MPGISSSQNGITITRSDSPNQGVVIGTTNYGSNFSHFGMSDNISNITGASGVFAFYNHNQNNFGFSLLGQSGTAKSVFTLTNADLGNKAAFEIENQSTINSTGILRLRNIPDSANVELHVGTSSPEGIITSDISSIFFQRDGTASGTQLYIKTQDGNNQGWVGVATVDMLGNINQANNGLSVSGTEVILGGTLYQSTVIDGNGGANDFTLQDVKNFSLGGGGAGAVGDIANTLLRLTGTDEFQIRTPNFLLATTGSVLTLIDPATGKVEFATATANEVDTLQTVTNRGNSTTNTIQFAGGTSTNSFSISSGQLAVNTTTYRNVANFVGNDILGTYISVQNLNTSADDTGLRVFNELNQQVARFGYYLGGDVGFALSDIGDFQVGSVDVAGDIDFYAGAALRGRFTNLGRLGIGTVTPSSRLHVVATSSAIGAIQTLQNSIGDIQFFVSTGTPNGFITGSAGDISFGTDGKLYIKETGTSTNTGWSVIATGTQSGSVVQGSGSAGQIVLWNSTSSVTGNSLFTYSTSSGSVKIGTGTPSVSGQQFTLMNTNAAGMVIESTTGTGISYLELRHSSGATSDYQVDSSGAFIGSTSNDPFYLTTNNNARLYITPVGQIGIGTNTPSAQLDVYSAATATFPLLTLENSDGNFQIFNASTTPEGLITGSHGDLAIDSTNGRMYIKQSGTSTNTGWVAFATGTPAELDTLQTVTNRGNQTTTTIQFAGGTSTGAFAVQSTSTMQDIVPAGLYTGNMSAFNLGTSSTRWNSLWAGTVNIGTSTWSLTQSSNGRFSVFNQPSGDGTEVISVQTDGKVGIGNTSPTNRLSVGNGTTGIERVDINGLNQAILEFKQADSSKWMLSSGDIANSFGIYSYGFGYKLVVGQTGNITFGGENVNPLSTTGKSVTVSGDLNERASLFVRTTEQDNAGSMAALGFLAEANTAAANEQMARIEMLTVGSTLNNRGSQLGFYTKPDGGAMALAATIDSSGRLIVGTSTVSAKFTVYQSSTSTALAQFGNSGSDFQVFSVNGSPQSSIVGSIGDIAIDATNGRMYFKETGNSTNTGWVNIATGTNLGVNTFVQNGNTFSTTGTLGTNDAFALSFETNNVERMFITSGGNVNIGTSTSNGTLTVSGGYNTAYAQGATSTIRGGLSLGRAVSSGFTPMTIQDTSGRIGIFNDLSSPVNSAIVTVGTNDQNQYLNFARYSSATDKAFLYSMGGGFAFGRTGGALGNDLVTNPNRVGIGNFGDTDSATSTLHIKNTSIASTTGILTIENGSGDFQVFNVSNNPESLVTGSRGDLAIDSTNGRMYIKQTGAQTNTGWAVFATSTSSGTDTLQTVTNRGNSTTNTIQFAGGTSTGVFTLSKSLIEGGGVLEPQMLFKDTTSTGGIVLGRYSTGVDENYSTLAFTSDTSLNPSYTTSISFDYSHVNNNLLMRSYGGGVFKNGISIGDVLNFESALNHGIGVTSAFNFTNYGSLKGIMSFSNPQASMDFFMSTGSPVGVISGNSGSLYFQTDAPSTSTAHLFLKTADSSSAGWKPVAILDSNGNLGIGTSTPALPLHVYSAATSGSIARFTNTDGSCDIDPTNSALVCSSDANLKKNVLKIEGSLEKIMALRGVLFNWNKEDDTDVMHSGFIAQEVQAVLPGLVMQGQDGKLAVNYTGFAPYLVGALQEQQNAIQSLQKSIGSNDLQSAATTTFNNNLVLTAQFIASGDMVGQARIKAHQTAVSVRFSKPYTVQPIIVVTPRGEMALAQNFKYAVVEEKNSGFTIKIDMERDADIDFNWHAIGAGEGSALTVSDGTTSTIQLIVSDVPGAPIMNQSSQSVPVTPTPDPISPPESPMTQPQTEPVPPVEMQRIEQMPSISIETQQDAGTPAPPTETVQVQ